MDTTERRSSPGALSLMWDRLVALSFASNSLFAIYQLPVLLMPIPLVFIVMWWPWLALPLIAYGLWYVFDYGSQERGGRTWLWCQNKWVKAMHGHIPVKLVKTGDLDPERNYIMGSHPHGVCAMGALGAFSIDVAGFGSLFPGISPRFHLNGWLFLVPFAREFFLATGCLAVSERSMQYMLRKSPKGLACALVVGGMRETAEEWTSHIALYLKKRKGFVRVAIEHGADLVPTFTFGENQLYHKYFDMNEFVRSTDSKFLKAVQEWFFSQWLNPFIFAYGRAVFFGQWGLAPFRVPLTVVVGEPIKVTQMDNPPEDEINRLHEQYVETLKHLYDTYNPIYGDINVPLVIK